jgi:hypothetical protein
MIIFISGDRSVVWEARLQRSFVVQVILTDKPISSTSAITTTDHLTTINDNINQSNPTSVQLLNSSLIERT